MTVQTIKLDTPDGPVSATKAGPDSPWVITYHTGSDRYFGTLPQAKARMKRRIAQESADDQE